MGELGDEDQDGQCIDESHHDATRDEAHQLGDAEEAQHDLEQAGQKDCRNQVVDSVLARQWSDDQCDGAGSCGDHCGSSADDGDGHCHRERREQSYPRIDAGDDRERDRLGNQCQRHDQSGQNLRFETVR